MNTLGKDLWKIKLQTKRYFYQRTAQEFTLSSDYNSDNYKQDNAPEECQSTNPYPDRSTFY